MRCFVFLFVFFFFGKILCDPQLLVNVKNQGRDTIQETIAANASQNVVVLEFQRLDGALITQFFDFLQDVQITKVLLLGEEEKGQREYQVMCFISYASSDEFISSGDIAKLRQFQRQDEMALVAEEDKGTENVTLNIPIIVTGPRGYKISKHIPGLCAEAVGNTFTSYTDIQIWSSFRGASAVDFLDSVRYPKGVIMTPKIFYETATCDEESSMWNSCICELPISVPWYPCGVKYCNADDTSESYKCGVRTCRKLYNFQYLVNHKQHCLWDE